MIRNGRQKRSQILPNAVKYSPAGTKVEIRVERFISYVLIEVEDEGVGILKKDYPNIFKRFYRDSIPEVENTEGTGIGLYLVHQILEGQGGRYVHLRPEKEEQ